METKCSLSFPQESTKSETQCKISFCHNEELFAPRQITSWITTPYQLATSWRHATLLWRQRQICLNTIQICLLRGTNWILKYKSELFTARYELDS
jgi:hypothetical protein